MNIQKQETHSVFTKVFQVECTHYIALTMMCAFSLDKAGELLDEAELWRTAGSAIGNRGLLDIFMPDMNGYQVMDFISKRCPDTLVIVVSGHASIKSAIKFIKKGAYDYIRKPFEPEELLVTIKNGLDHKRLKSENEVINEKLIRTEECYRFLVQNSPDIIYILDGKGRFHRLPVLF